MFEDFAGISIEWRSFTSKTDLLFFCKKNEKHENTENLNQKKIYTKKELSQEGKFSTKPSTNRYTIIYGSNGSGKTTIANALSFLSSSLKEETIETIEKEQIEKVDVHYLNSEGKVIENEKELISNTVVFSEKFIKDNILLRDNNLENIVFIGSQVPIQHKIDDFQTYKLKYENLLDDREKQLEEVETSKDKESIKSIKNVIKEKIKKYYIRERASFSDKASGTNITDSLFNEICNTTVSSLVYDELTSKYRSCLEQFNLANEYNEAFSLLPNFKLQEYINNFLSIQKLLSQKVEDPKLSERELKIIDTINQVGFKKELTDEIINRRIPLCPTCFRPIDENFSSTLKQTLQRVFSKDADIHSEALNNINIPNFDNLKKSVNSIPILRKEDYLEFDDTCKTYDIQCISIQEAIKKKQSNLYTPINFDIEPIIDCLKKIDSLVISMNQKINNHNKTVGNIKLLRVSLENQLKLITRIQIDNDLKKLKFSESNAHEIKLNLEDFKCKLAKIKSEISNLKHKQKNTKIAISKINLLLTLTFGSKNRLELVEGDSGYAVKVRGKVVHPDMISTGERNILALCYFFIKSQDNTEEDSIFKHKKFYVIDDPISSFDDANRIGVLTLLNQIFYKILAGNSDSKVLLLTHDLWTMQSLDSNFKAINNSLTSKTFINLCHLKKQSLANNNVKSLNRYKMYLFNVYKFASTQSKQSELYTDIGNEIRKVLEAYFTFNFANGIDYLSQQEIFKENLTLADYAEYFQGRVLKLFFHDDSHMENTIKYLTDGRFYDEDEIKRAAQDVLVFLFLHNKQHIFNYLATSQKNAILEDCYQVNEHELEDNLNKWKSNIDMELGL